MKPDSKLKQWCWDKAINSCGGVTLPFLTHLESKNERQYRAIQKRAKYLYEWITKKE